MQIVIDVPKSWEKCNNTFLRNCIRNGKVLPKGHGDLIDRTALASNEYFDVRYGSDIYWEFVRIICNQKTIVPTDKEDSNGDSN